MIFPATLFRTAMVWEPNPAITEPAVPQYPLLRPNGGGNISYTAGS